MAVDNHTVFRNGLQLGATVAVNQILNESDLSSNSAEAIPTQSSVKAYVDSYGVGSLDLCYDYGGSGAGRSITADSGAVAITAPDTSGNSALDVTQNDVTNNPSALIVSNAGTGSAIELAGAGSRKITSSSADLSIETVTSGTITLSSAGLTRVGSGTPSKFTGTAGDLYVANRMEVGNTIHFVSQANFYVNFVIHDNAGMYFGTGNDVQISYLTGYQTVDTLAIGVSTDSNYILVCQKGDLGYDFGHGLKSNPTLILQSANQSQTEWTYVFNDGSNTVLETGVGGFDFNSYLQFDQISAPGTTTDKLYNVSGNLTWNGSKLAEISGTPSDGQISVWTDSETLEGTDTFTFASGSLYVRQDAGYASLWALAYGSGATEYGQAVVGRSRGTQASPTAIQSGDALGAYQFFGQYATGSWNKGASIESFASETWSTGNYGCNMVFNTTLNTEGTQTERMRIQNDGKIGMGTDSPDYGLDVVGSDLTYGSIGITRYTTGTGGPVLRLYHSRGDESTPTALSSGDTLASIYFGGYDSDSFEFGTLIHSVTTQAWSNSARGSELQFYTVADGSTSGSLRLTIGQSGTLTAPQVYSDTVGGTNRDLFVDNTGKLGYVSSAKRYKKYIKTLKNVNFLDELRPVTFQFRKDKNSSILQYGLIAEEVEKVNKDFIFYEGDRIEGVHYKKFIPVLIKAHQDAKNENEKLKVKLEKIEAKLEKISKKKK